MPLDEPVEITDCARCDADGGPCVRVRLIDDDHDGIWLCQDCLAELHDYAAAGPDVYASPCGPASDGPETPDPCDTRPEEGVSHEP
jgi:hypothetical protein